jgi:hypothetical protein
MCDESLSEPYGGYTLPPACLRLMQNADEVDPDTVAAKVTVDLCEECTEIGRKMALEYDTSPLPECDATAARWQAAGAVEAIAGGDATADDDLTERMAMSALSAVKADLDGDGSYMLDSKLTEARVTVLSLDQLGIIDTDLLD